MTQLDKHINTLKRLQRKKENIQRQIRQLEYKLMKMMDRPLTSDR